VLVLTHSVGELIVIRPSPDIDPNLTVAELFANGAIEIVALPRKTHQIALGIKAPDKLTICREELYKRAK